MFSKICCWLLDMRVGWGEHVAKPFDIWLYKHIK